MRQQPRRGDPLDGVGGLDNECGWFSALRLLGHRGVSHQLRQAT
jgi:hypothetical protein